MFSIDLTQAGATRCVIRSMPHWPPAWLATTPRPESASDHSLKTARRN